MKQSVYGACHLACAALLCSVLCVMKLHLAARALELRSMNCYMRFYRGGERSRRLNARSSYRNARQVQRNFGTPKCAGSNENKKHITRGLCLRRDKKKEKKLEPVSDDSSLMTIAPRPS